MRFEGVIPPVITPMKPDRSIDRDGFVGVVEHLCASGVHGVIVGGTTGEYYAQTAEERVDLMRLGRQAVKGVALIVGVGATRTEDSVAFAEAARAAGTDGILIGAPPYALPTPEELADHVRAVDRAARLPIMLYNYPGRTGTLMSRPFFDLVARDTHVRAIKESSGSIEQLHMLANDYPGIDLFCGMDDQALEFYAWGAKGWVCGAGNCLPAEHLALHRACAIENDVAKGRRIMAALLPLMHVLEQGGKFVQCIKHGCALAGLPAGPVRRPLAELDERRKAELAETIATLKQAIAEIDRGAMAPGGGRQRAVHG